MNYFERKLVRLCERFIYWVDKREQRRQNKIKKEAAKYMEEYLEKNPELLDTLYLNPITALVPLYSATPPRYSWEAMKRGEIEIVVRSNESRNTDKAE